MSTAAAADLVKAIAALRNVTADKTADTGTYKYRYADLPAILDMARPILAEHNLAVMQDVTTADNGDVAVSTRIYHSSGEVFLFGPLHLGAGKTAQNAGSAITYARRYALAAALGVAADEDDDGANAGPAPSARKKQTRPTPPPPPVEPDERTVILGEIGAGFDRLGVDKRLRGDYVKAVIGHTFDSASSLPIAELEQVAARIRQDLEVTA